MNLTGGTCVKACSVLNIGIKFAGVTVNGVCLCSLNDYISLQRVSSSSCLYPQSDGLYYKVYPVTEHPTLNISSRVATFKDFNVTIYSPGRIFLFFIFLTSSTGLHQAGKIVQFPCKNSVLRVISSYRLTHYLTVIVRFVGAGEEKWR